jgi:hypothetical protein
VVEGEYLRRQSGNGMGQPFVPSHVTTPCVTGQLSPYPIWTYHPMGACTSCQIAIQKITDRAVYLTRKNSCRD